MLRIAMGVLALGALIAAMSVERHAPRSRIAPVRHAPEPEPRRVQRAPEVIAPRLKSGDADERWQATLEMIGAGPDAVPALLTLQRLSAWYPPPDEEEWVGKVWCVKAHVAYAALQIGKPAIPPLAEALEGEYRLQAIRLLGVLGTRHDEVLGPLITCLDPEGYEDTYTAAFAIARMGERGAPALPELSRLFESEDVSWAAADCIVDLGAAAVPYIERELQRSYNGRLMGNLDHLEADCGPLVPTLIEVLQRGESHQKRDAAWAIAEIGPPAAAAREVLLEYARHPKTLGWNTSISGNYCSVDALLAIGVPDDEAEELIASILDRGEAPSLLMCERVGRMDPRRAERIRPRILESLGGNDYAYGERIDALHATSPARPPRPPDTRTLDELIDFTPAEGPVPPSERPHWWGINRGIPRRYFTLADRAPLPPRAVEVLREQLTAGDAADRVGAALALRTSDVDPSVYLQALIEGLRPENYRGLGMSRRRWRDAHLRKSAAETLAGLGERARPALPALYHVLDSRNEPVAKAARAALARLE